MESLNQPHTDYGSTTTRQNELVDKEKDTKSRFSSRKYRRIMEVENVPRNWKTTVRPKIEFAANILNQILIGFVTIYMSYLCLRLGLAGTALHAWFVTLGFSFLMAEGIMCHYSGNVLTSSYKRTTKTTIHWILQSTGGALGVTGILIKCFQKDFLLTSTHGKLGFSTLIICLVSMMTGLASLYAIKLKSYISPLMSKFVHNFLGIATLTVALTTQFYGYKTGFFMKNNHADFQTVMQCITLTSLILTVFGPLKALYTKLKLLTNNV